VKANSSWVEEVDCFPSTGENGGKNTKKEDIKKLWRSGKGWQMKGCVEQKTRNLKKGPQSTRNEVTEKGVRK